MFPRGDKAMAGPARRAWLTPVPRIAVSCVGFRERLTAGMTMVVARRKRVTQGFLRSPSSAGGICSPSRAGAKPTSPGAGPLREEKGRFRPQPRLGRKACASLAHSPPSRGSSLPGAQERKARQAGLGFPAPEQQMHLYRLPKGCPGGPADQHTLPDTPTLAHTCYLYSYTAHSTATAAGRIGLTVIDHLLKGQSFEKITAPKCVLKC